ncbi:P27 family predicted phage terminase small subunit [Actinokineospora baliensis]|nr:P27 family predicted phage terminase small subunit [Actinokineospora baliensis]
MITRYCDLHERRAALVAEIDRDGLSVEGSQGQPVAHWALRYVESTERELRAIEATLGLNLEARLRLGLAASAVRKQSLSEFLDDE